MNHTTIKTRIKEFFGALLLGVFSLALAAMIMCF